VGGCGRGGEGGTTQPQQHLLKVCPRFVHLFVYMRVCMRAAVVRNIVHLLFLWLEPWLEPLARTQKGLGRSGMGFWWNVEVKCSFAFFI
jgi:hypothetical protein